ncbi:DNA transposase THAP9 [Eumeta japonica]|uniref:DNA transposase THAP9 n=1 Tax=Eumeta variegata TaxID=151549 RepID=A0A4C1WJZ8_EUMVA|nr:DNA transposase THAP9 [Eumeta japonica]
MSQWRKTERGGEEKKKGQGGLNLRIAPFAGISERQFRAIEETWLPSNHTYICSLHFHEEDKYTTKAGRRFLKKSAVPCIDPRVDQISTGTIEPISESISESESIFDTPRKIVLKRKIHDITISKKKLTDKIKKVQRQNRNLKKKCESLTLLVKSLKSKFSLDGIAGNNLLAKAELVEIHKRLINKNKKSKYSSKYTPALRKFALTLHYYSPAAYKYIRNIYNNVLPHTRTLCRWYGTIDAEPGFTNEAFHALKMKSKSSGKSLVCNLVFDEMAIRKQRLFHNQQKLGAINFGAGPQEGDADDNVASQALVFIHDDEQYEILSATRCLESDIEAENNCEIFCRHSQLRTNPIWFPVDRRLHIWLHFPDSDKVIKM